MRRSLSLQVCTALLFALGAAFMSASAWALTLKVDPRVPRDGLVECTAVMSQGETGYTEYLWVVVGANGFIDKEKLLYEGANRAKCRFVAPPGEYKILLIGLRANGAHERDDRTTTVFDPGVPASPTPGTDGGTHTTPPGPTSAPQVTIQNVLDSLKPWVVGLTPNERKALRGALEHIAKQTFADKAPLVAALEAQLKSNFSNLLTGTEQTRMLQEIPKIISAISRIDTPSGVRRMVIEFAILTGSRIRQ